MNGPNTNMSEERLSWKQRIGYGIGDFGNAFIWQMTTMFLLFFYTDVFGISAAAVGTLLLVARVFDAVNDPVMGMVTERIRTRWGKFRHYLLFGPPVLGVFMVLTFSTPDLSASGKLVYAYVTYIGLGVVYTATNLPYGALATTMTQDARERNSLSALRSFFAIVGAALIGIATPVLVKTLGSDNPAKGFQLVAVIFSFIGLICIWTTFATSQERFVAVKQAKVLSFGQLLGIIKINTPFILLTSSFLLVASGGFIRLTAPAFFVTYYLKRPELLGPFLGLGSLAMLAGILLSQPLAGRLGKRNTYITGQLILALASLALFFTPHTAVVPVFAWYLAGSIGFGFAFALTWSMISDTVEYAEWKTGIRTEGGVYSISSFSIKLSSAIAGGVPAMILAWTAYVPNAEQTEIALSGINWMMSLAPGVFALAGIVPMLYYKLDEKMFTRIVTELEARKQAGTV